MQEESSVEVSEEVVSGEGSDQKLHIAEAAAVATVASVESQEQQVDSAQAQVEEATPTEDETPDWFMKDKFNSVEAQAKSYSELQKKMGKYWGSPEDKYSSEGLEDVDDNDPLLTGLIPVLKDIGLSQEGLKHLAEGYKEANMQMVQKLEDELKKELTVNDAHTYQAVNKWMGDNLTPEEVSTVQNNWLLTPKDFKVFNQMRLMTAASTSVPSSRSGNAIKFESSAEVENEKIKYRKEVKQKIRVPDKNYSDELSSRYRDARTRETR